MLTIKNEYIVMCDIDDTLVMHDWPEDIDTCNLIQVEDTTDSTKSILVRINHPMVRLIKEEAARGAQIFFWSAGGYQWAENVVKALNLHIYDSIIMSKPVTYCDDKKAEEFMSRRVYLGPDVKYKRQSKPNLT